MVCLDTSFIIDLIRGKINLEELEKQINLEELEKY